MSNHYTPSLDLERGVATCTADTFKTTYAYPNCMVTCILAICIAISPPVYMLGLDRALIISGVLPVHNYNIIEMLYFK